MPLDRVDRQILHALQLAPRASFARIAGVLGVSEQTAARRYQRMRTDGVVRVLARPEPIRRTGTSYWTLRIGCRPGTATGLADALAERGDTSWISIGAGGAEISCQITVTAADRAGLLHHLPRASNVLTFSAHQMLHRFPGRGEADWVAGADRLDDDQQAALREGDAGVPAGVLDETDGPLLAALVRDGRASWATLAAATGASPRQVAHRVAALIAGDQIFFHLDVAATEVGIGEAAVLWFAVAPADLARVGATVADHPEVAFAAAVTGAANLMAAVQVRDATALYHYLTTKIAAVDGVRAVETVPMISRVKQAHFRLANGRVQGH